VCVFFFQYSRNSANFTLKNEDDENGLSTLHIQYKFPWEQVTIETIQKCAPDRLESVEQKTGKDCQVVVKASYRKLKS